MRFGLRIPLLFDPASDDPLHQTYALAQEAEAAGFDFLSLTHHSFTPECQTSAPFVVLAAIAARTRKIKLAPVIYILPLYHPAAVAEQVATLDVVSNGRAIFGIGIGYRDYEFEGHGVNPRHRGARADEAMTAIRQAWSTGRFDFQGKHFQIPPLPAVPMPVQRPYPPMWVGGISDAGMRRAARLGDGWITDNMQSLSAEAEMAERYRAYCKLEGREPFIVVTRNAWVANTREEVAADWYQSVIDFHLDYLKAGLDIPDPTGIYARFGRGEDVPLMEFVQDRAIAGIPADCADQLRRWRDDVGAGAMLFLLNEDAGMEKMQATIRLFGEKVFPLVAGKQ